MWITFFLTDLRSVERQFVPSIMFFAGLALRYRMSMWSASEITETCRIRQKAAIGSTDCKAAFTQHDSAAKKAGGLAQSARRSTRDSETDLVICWALNFGILTREYNNASGAACEVGDFAESR